MITDVIVRDTPNKKLVTVTVIEGTGEAAVARSFKWNKNVPLTETALKARYKKLKDSEAMSPENAAMATEIKNHLKA